MNKTQLEILNGTNYPEKAGMLMSDARHLRRVLETIIGMVTDLPNYADDPVLEAIVYVGSEAVEITEYLADK